MAKSVLRWDTALGTLGAAGIGSGIHAAYRQVYRVESAQTPSPIVVVDVNLR